jgi:cell pole-organizing protein PopZ
MPVVEHRDPAPAPASAVAPVSSASVVSSPTSSSSSSPSLAEAFAALLSAEQGRSISASKVGASSISEQTIDDIVSRVISRMTDQSVRETVLDVAERLVREEIDRIKEGSR